MFLIPYILIFLGFTALVYAISDLAMKGIPEQEPSMYGLGLKGFKKFMTTNVIAESQNNKD